MSSVESTGARDYPFYGNVRPLLNEVLHAVDRLLEHDDIAALRLADLHDPGIGHRQPEPIGVLVDEDKIADEQCRNHRTRGNLERLEQKRPEQQHDEQDREHAGAALEARKGAEARADGEVFVQTPGDAAEQAPGLAVAGIRVAFAVVTQRGDREQAAGLAQCEAHRHRDAQVVDFTPGTVHGVAVFILEGVF